MDNGKWTERKMHTAELYELLEEEADVEAPTLPTPPPPPRSAGSSPQPPHRADLILVLPASGSSTEIDDERDSCIGKLTRLLNVREEVHEIGTMLGLRRSRVRVLLLETIPSNDAARTLAMNMLLAKTADDLRLRKRIHLERLSDDALVAAGVGPRSVQIFEQSLQACFRPPRDQLDEWTAQEREQLADSLLFTSMERIRLLTHIIERPESEGGCGLGSLGDLCLRRVFGAVVAVHDPLRTGDGLDGPRSLSDAAALLRLKAALPAQGRPAGRAAFGKRALSMSTGLISELLLPLMQMQRVTRDAYLLLAGNRVRGTLMSSWAKTTLHEFFARSSWLPDQPLDDIRDYLGEEIAFYFAFLQSLTWALLAPAVFGILPMAYGLYRGSMDNVFTSLQAPFCLIWVFAFIKHWRRRSRQLAFAWQVENYAEVERLRPEYVTAAASGAAITPGEAMAKVVRAATGGEGLRRPPEPLGGSRIGQPGLGAEYEIRAGLYTPEGDFVDVEGERPPPVSSTQSRPLTEPRMISTFDRSRRARRIAISACIVLLLIVVAVVVTECIMLLRTLLMAYFWRQSPAYFEQWPLATLIYPYRVYVGAGVAAVFNTLWITVSNQVFVDIADHLTAWEHHMTPLDHDNMLIYKRFCFQFINSYASLFYIAFVKGQPRMSSGVHEGQYLTAVLPWAEVLLIETTSAPFDYCHDPANFGASPVEISRAFRATMDSSQARHVPRDVLLNPFCVGELTAQLSSLIILREVIDIALQNVMPKLQAFLLWTLRRRPSRHDATSQERRRPAAAAAGEYQARRDDARRKMKCRADSNREDFYQSQLEKVAWRGVLVEYTELVIGVGYVVLFAPAFPLAALFVYIFTAMKLKNDAFKLLRLYQRPLPRIKNGIGTWEHVIVVLGFLGVATNTVLVLCTATQMYEQLPFTLPLVNYEVNASNHLLFFVFVEHMILAVQFLITSVVMDSDPSFSKARTRSLWEETKLFARLRRKRRTGGRGKPFDHLGPWVPRPIDHVLMGFETVSRDGHYTIDLGQPINHMLPLTLADEVVPSRYAKSNDGAQSERNLHNRSSGALSGLSAITLPSSQWAAANIPPTAEYVAYAYPLTKLGARRSRPVQWPPCLLRDAP